MTLQQKLLAKQSKKGFTLVELVVVIAILAILAAIAIPSVIGIISSATLSAGKSDASTLDEACKELYASVSSGTLNASSTDLNNLSASKLPASSASDSTKKSVAKTLTPTDAMNYSGLALNLDDFVYVTTATSNYAKGTILYSQDEDVTSSSVSATAVTSSTTFANMY